MKKPGIFILALFSLLCGCIDTFNFSGEITDFESVLVVEAVLTDEVKQQEVRLSRSRQFNEDTFLPESGADVRIVDDQQTEFLFEEVTSGQYVSTQIFAASSGRSYQLQIQRANGTTYMSDVESLSGNPTLIDLYAEKTTNDDGEEGVTIFIDNSNTSSEPSYYRFSYEETSKIIAPDWNPFDFVIPADNDPNNITVAPRDQEEEVCYIQETSNRIVLANTVNLSENRINRFPIRFLAKDDFRIANRYSILLRQFGQSATGYGYFEALQDFSQSESIFSEVQPGFLEGNIASASDEDEKVLGYFEVVSVDSERLFFNYEDFFERDGEVAYPLNCGNLGAPQLTTPAGTSPLLDGIVSGTITYVGTNEGQIEEGGPFLTAKRECGDCTALGSNIVPEFWIE